MDSPKPSKPFEEQIEKFIALLRRTESREALFNLYHDGDPAADVRGAAAKRRENLRRYLKAIREPGFALISLAPRYAGTRFTGVPLTSEHRLCFPGSCFDRTSMGETAMRDAEAEAVMELLGARLDVVCFSAVPWHPHSPEDLARDAAPDEQAVASGKEALEWFFTRLYPRARPLALGEAAHEALRKAGVLEGEIVTLSGLDQLRERLS